MTVFVDASALVSIINGEDDADMLADRLMLDQQRIIGPVALWETVAAVHKDRGGTVPEALREVERFCGKFEIAMVEIASAETSAAVEAHSLYGRRSGSLARLNMGDCFAYACAKTNGASLLYKGADFLHTDLA